MKAALFPLAIVLALCGQAAAAQGDRPDEEERPPGAVPVVTVTPPPEKANRPAAVEGGMPFVIQKRKYEPGHEFRLATGYMPQDAFYKGTTADFSYTYHFGDFFSWEVMRGLYSWNHSTDLTRRLSEEFDVENDPYEKAQYLLFTMFQFTPFYGKQTVMNRMVVHHELYFMGGPGGVGWVLHENGRSDRPTEFRPAVNAGFGFRWYASRLVSFKLEVLENLYQKRDGIDDQVYVNVGISLSTRR